MKFQAMYDRLNPEQRRAVDTIEGPLLVLAGPGTGKTQLLSARVASILQRTDVDASNILCLTFTESGAQNMRERLRSFIGEQAYDVTISTYHSFGSDIIKQYSRFFQSFGVDRTDDVRMERPIDELSQIQIMTDIVNGLPYDSPLLSARYYIKSVVSTISDLKQQLITPADLRSLAAANIAEITAAQPILDTIINDHGGFSRKKNDKQAQYDALLDAMGGLRGQLGTMAFEALSLAHQAAREADSPTPLTTWKNTWLHKNDADKFTLTDQDHSLRMLTLADIYEQYQASLQSRAAYDFDDMILRSIQAIETNEELKFNLQEKYQYILLDEFQDTNPAQFSLVQQIANHPIHEGRPNIMAVGDDDQAIFAFQGAHIGNMKEFLAAYRDVAVINLTRNYRSHADILHVAHNIADQITERLHRALPTIDKLLIAEASHMPSSSSVERHEFDDSASEYQWTAEQIKTLIAAGSSPQNIAVLAPKHRLLEQLVPFLDRLEIPVSYEKRENILETPIIQGLRISSQLLLALNARNNSLSNYYFPQVLSLPFWNIAAQDIWKVNWELAKASDDRSWAEIALTMPATAQAVTFYLKLSLTVASEPLERTLDQLIGLNPIEDSGMSYVSPLRSYYFSEQAREHGPLAYYEAISHLSVIRSRIREYQAVQDNQLILEDFVTFCNMYEAAEASLINSHPIAISDDAVQLMTAYKAKGLEFDHVFILQAHDDTWGGASKGNSNKLTLPVNLRHIRYTASSDDERLRLFFVAITRAKHNLYITSHRTKESGKHITPLKYLAEADGISNHLPAHANTIKQTTLNLPTHQQSIETLWRAGTVMLPANLKSLLNDRLNSYRMSPTHLNSFIDIEHAGPESFLVGTLLRFPQAPSASGEYGTAIHNSLEWYQNQRDAGQQPSTEQVLTRYEYELTKRYLTAADRAHYLGKGQTCLRRFLSANTVMFERDARAEVNFYGEGVTLGNAVLSGKIDRLEIDESNKTVRIVDYKTGSPLKSWQGSSKAHKYRQQLYFYKILIEQSISWRNYRVIDARLEFIESPAHSDEATPPLILSFQDSEEAQLKALIQAIWSLIQAVDMPDVSHYSPDLRGIKAFEADLLTNNKTPL